MLAVRAVAALRYAVYLLDFACYKPGTDHVVAREGVRRQPRLPAEDPRAVGAGAWLLFPIGGAQHAAQPLHGRHRSLGFELDRLRLRIVPLTVPPPRQDRHRILSSPPAPLADPLFHLLPASVQSRDGSDLMFLLSTGCAGRGWCSGRKNTLGNVKPGRLGRQPRPSAAATSSTRTTSSHVTPVPSRSSLNAHSLLLIGCYCCLS